MRRGCYHVLQLTAKQHPPIAAATNRHRLSDFVVQVSGDLHASPLCRLFANIDGVPTIYEGIGSCTALCWCDVSDVTYLPCKLGVCQQAPQLQTGSAASF